MAAGPVDHGAGRVFVAEVGAERGGSVAGGGQFGCQLGGAVERLVGVDGDAESVGGEGANDDGADAGGAAGYQGYG